MAAKFKRYTYNGVTCQATGRRSSPRDDKAWERTVRYQDNERTVAYADPDMPMRRNNPEARANFLSRHNCDAKRDPFAPGFWACYDWANPDEKEEGMEMEHKTFDLQIKGIDGRTVEGYAAMFDNVDLGGDVIRSGAFRKTLAERGFRVKFLWQHDRGEPIGKMMELREDDYGLFFKAAVSDTARGRDALALLQDGAISGVSIGYEAVKGGTSYTEGGDGTVRELKEIKLYEVSLVTFPMNEQARVTALKEDAPTADAADEDAPDDEKATDKRKSAAAIRAAMGALHEALTAAGIDLSDDDEDEPEEDMGKADHAANETKATDNTEAGPHDAPTSESELVKLLELEIEALSLYEEA